MGNIKFNASKKTTIILLVVLFFVIGGSGGYLLWRVNQSKTVAPTDSSAGGGEGGSTCNCCKTVPHTDPASCYDGNGALKRGMIPCQCVFSNTWCPGTELCTDTHPYNPPAKRSGAECDVPRCVWPYVAWWLPDRGEGNCACAHRTTSDPNPDLRCDDPTPRCTPPPCPPGYTDMHRPGGGTEFEPRNYSAEDLALIEAANLFHHNVRIVCKENGNDKLCFTECGQERCRPCRNPYWVRRMCKKAPEPPQPQCGDREVNQASEECDPPGSTCTKNGKQGVCDDKCKCPVVADPPRIEKCDGEDKDSGITFTPPTVKKGATINYKYIMGDSKGLDVKSVSVLLNRSTLDVEKNVSPSSGTPTKATVSGKLDTSTVGKHNVMIAWKRPGETSFSEACQIRGNFTVEDVGTPKWDVAKTASEECIVDSDGESIAKLTYTITIKNNGNATGTITNVTDKLDSKVVAGSVTDISDGGVYSSSNNSIKWGSFQIAAGQTKTLTYSYTVKKDAFGTYDNTVTIKPSDGTDYIANASITADCVEEPYQPPVEGGKVPETGLFDESENLVIMGGILLFLGLGWTWLNRTYQIVNGKLVQRSKERFEQRVVKN